MPSGVYDRTKAKVNKGLFLAGHPQFNTGRTWIKKGTALRKGAKHSEETKRKMGWHRKGIMPANIEFLKTNRIGFRKENPLSPESKRIRKSIEYRLWREAVFSRDNYTCQICGKRGGGELHPDHIKQFAYHPELRFAIDNGRTLCASCHRKTPTYGRKKHLCCD